MVSLWLNGKTFSRKELQNKFQAESNFEQKVLDFVCNWLAEQENFEIQTSGSTGVSKTISFTRKQLEASALFTQRALQLEKNFNSLVCLHPSHIAGQMMLVRSLMTDMNIFAVEPTANPFKHLPKEIKIDFVALVPYQVQAIMESDDAYRFNEIKTVIIGGAPLPLSVHEVLQKFSCSFYATYGMTETISHIALQKLNGADRQFSFAPLPSFGIRRDDRGCLIISAPHISETEIITNDLVEINDDGSFKILGRWDNVINSGGVKVIPEKIEQAIGRVFSNQKIKTEFFIAPMSDEKLGQTVNLIVEDTIWDESKIEIIESEIKEALSKYEVPKRMYFLQKFVRTPSGKISRIETVNLLPVRL